MSLQKESDWKVKVRDWWYSVQDAQKCPDEIKRVEIEHIIQETLAHREKEIAEEVEKLDFEWAGTSEAKEKDKLVYLHEVLQILKY